MTNAGADQELLTSGQAESATDGLDSHLGEEELPPMPPTAVFDARLAAAGLNGLTVDLRAADASAMEWQINLPASRGARRRPVRVQPGGANGPAACPHDARGWFTRGCVGRQELNGRVCGQRCVSV